MRGATIVVLEKTVITPFQSTRPMRGATLSLPAFAFDDMISIHAPHAGRDEVEGYNLFCTYISIHAPHAGRDAMGA